MKRFIITSMEQNYASVSCTLSVEVPIRNYSVHAHSLERFQFAD